MFCMTLRDKNVEGSADDKGLACEGVKEKQDSTRSFELRICGSC